MEPEVTGHSNIKTDINGGGLNPVVVLSIKILCNMPINKHGWPSSQRVPDTGKNDGRRLKPLQASLAYIDKQNQIIRPAKSMTRKQTNRIYLK